VSHAEIIAGQCARVHRYRGPDPGIGEIANTEFGHSDFCQDRSGPLIAWNRVAAVEHDVAEAFPQARCGIAPEVKDWIRTVGMRETMVWSETEGKQCRIRSFDPEPFPFDLAAPRNQALVQIGRREAERPICLRLIRHTPPPPQ